MTEPVIELDGVDKTYRFFRLSRRAPAARGRTDHGLRRPERRRQVDDDPDPDGDDSAGPRHRARPRPRACRSEQAAAKRDIGFVSEDMRLHGTATLGWHMRFVASIYPELGSRSTPTSLLRALQPARRAADQGSCRTASGSRRRCCSCSPGVRACCSSTSRRPGSTRSRGTRSSRSSWTSCVTSAARSCSRRTTRRTSSRSPTTSLSSIAAGSSTRATRRRSSIAGGDCTSTCPAGVALPQPAGVIDTTTSGRIAVVTTKAYTPDIGTASTSVRASPSGRCSAMTLEEIFVANVMNNRGEHAE